MRDGETSVPSINNSLQLLVWQGKCVRWGVTGMEQKCWGRKLPAHPWQREGARVPLTEMAFLDTCALTQMRVL